MPKFDWNNRPFWRRKAPLLERAARRWGQRDYREAMGSVWETLTARFQGGLVEGPNPEAYLDKTITAEANKFFRKESERRHRLAGRPLQPIDSADDPLDDVSPPDDDLITQEVSQIVGVLLQGLPCRERILIEARYGFDGDASSTTKIAAILGVSRQAVRKRIRRIEDRLRLRARRHHLAI